MGLHEAPAVPRAPGATRDLGGDTGDTGIAGRHARDAIVGRAFSGGLFFAKKSRPENFFGAGKFVVDLCLKEGVHSWGIPQEWRFFGE